MMYINHSSTKEAREYKLLVLVTYIKEEEEEVSEESENSKILYTFLFHVLHFIAVKSLL